MPPIEILMTDKDIGMKTLTDIRALSLITFCLLGTLLLPSLSTAAEGPQQTTEQVMQLDINTADAATIAAALTGIGPAKAKEIVAYREMFGSFRALEELLAVPGIGTAALEKNSGRILITDD